MSRLNCRYLAFFFSTFLLGSLSIEAFPEPLERKDEQVSKSDLPQLAQNINLSEFIA